MNPALDVEVKEEQHSKNCRVGRTQKCTGRKNYENSR